MAFSSVFLAESRDNNFSRGSVFTSVEAPLKRCDEIPVCDASSRRRKSRFTEHLDDVDDSHATPPPSWNPCRKRKATSSLDSTSTSSSSSVSGASDDDDDVVVVVKEKQASSPSISSSSSSSSDPSLRSHNSNSSSSSSSSSSGSSFDAEQEANLLASEVSALEHNFRTNRTPLLERRGHLRALSRSAEVLDWRVYLAYCYRHPEEMPVRIPLRSDGVAKENRRRKDAECRFVLLDEEVSGERVVVEERQRELFGEYSFGGNGAGGLEGGEDGIGPKGEREDGLAEVRAPEGTSWELLEMGKKKSVVVVVEEEERETGKKESAMGAKLLRRPALVRRLKARLGSVCRA